MKKNSTIKGQTLVEAIVVIAVVVLLVTGLVAGTTISLRSAIAGRTRSQALKYAEEALEFTRNMRDQRWDTLADYNGVYCFGSDDPLPVPTASSSCSTNITTPDSALARMITFTPDNVLPIPQKITVQVSVQYTEGSEPKDVTLTTYFTQWK